MNNRLVFLTILLAAPSVQADRAASPTSNGFSALDAAVIAPFGVQLALAQDARYYDDDLDLDDTLDALQEEVGELRNDWRTHRYASPDLDLAEDFIERLAAHPPGTLRASDLDRAEDLVERARDEAAADPAIVIIDSGDDELAREEADRARDEAARARAEAEAQREAALAAQLEAEHERGRYAELQSELSQMQTRETERGLVVTLGDVLFEVGRADLKGSATRALDQLVRAMREHPEATVIIEGHTDSTGARQYNYKLSERRANTVRSFLTRNGIAARRMQSRGLGPDSPVASNATATGRAQNRRVEVIVQNEGENSR